MQVKSQSILIVDDESGIRELLLFVTDRLATSVKFIVNSKFITETSNATVEVEDMAIFFTLQDAKVIIKNWKLEINNCRSHSSLGSKYYTYDKFKRFNYFYNKKTIFNKNLL